MDGVRCAREQAREAAREQVRHHLNGPTPHGRADSLAAQVRRVLDSQYGYRDAASRLAAIDTLLTRVGYAPPGGAR
jgi:hypothetical protein